jgi:hypothetical protein
MIEGDSPNVEFDELRNRFAPLVGSMASFKTIQIDVEMLQPFTLPLSPFSKVRWLRGV